MKDKKTTSLIAKNKKARHLYELLEFIEAGIVLTGSEIKSIRQGAVNFRDSYVTFRGGEAFLIGLHIAPYVNAGYAQHDPSRDRKLLLHSKEIHLLTIKIEQKGLTVVPVNIHFKHGKVKIEIAVARGKKTYDQRQDLKEAAEMRDVLRDVKNFQQIF